MNKVYSTFISDPLAGLSVDWIICSRIKTFWEEKKNKTPRSFGMKTPRKNSRESLK